MIRVNLLPWREARRKAQRQHLGMLGGMVAVLGLLIVGAVHLTIAGYISVQSDRNEFLKRENVRLDKEIEEIRKLKTEIAALLARKQVIERLQTDRAQAVYLTLMRNLGASPYLEKPDLVEIKATMVSNKRVSEFSMNVSLKQLQTEDAAKADKAGSKAAAAKR
jgi:type IV pilus assembly protein PilN